MLAANDSHYHNAAMQNMMTDDAATSRIFFEAIALKKLIRAAYNGEEMRLAPHLLFTRHGDMFISALNMDKNWRDLDERRLGLFKVDGLSGVSLIDETFEPLDDFDGTPPREGDEKLFSV